MLLLVHAMFWDKNKKAWKCKNLDFHFDRCSMMEYIDKFVYCNTLRSIKPAFLVLEKAMFTGATLDPMFTIITPGPYTHSKQSNAFHAKCNLKVNLKGAKMGWITESYCMSVTDLNQTVRYICHVVDVCSKLHKTFHVYCLFGMSDQLVVGTVFGCFWLKNYKNIVLRYSMTIKQYFCDEKSLN